MISYVYINVCKKYAASTISGLPFCTSWVRPIEKHLGGVLPLRSHLFPYSIAPCARAAAFVVSMILCGLRRCSANKVRVFQVIELSLAIDPYKMAPLQSFLVMTNFNTTLSDVRVFWYQFDGVDTSDLNFLLFMLWHKPHSTISLFTSWDWVSKMMSKLAPAEPSEKGEGPLFCPWATSCWVQTLQGMDKESKS